ncbi:MAG: ribosome recycling factor [Megasphaera sp.]|jgi:ribosome recycling factor|nr:ribosome recycling factor [Megasphaera sp.]MCH4187641.1 ribosome recycling factor [Megasphaera sp.]MCH4217163.1 ribosome recycling factor [Megasphaera sp.]
MDVKTLVDQHESKMDKTIESLKRDLAAIRTGRASTSLLDRIAVDYYGTPTPVKQVANVSAPEPRLITIVPWERNMLATIEKAILKSDLGLNPNNDGTMIRLEIPQLTEERRKELSKTVSKDAEEAKVAVRNIRRDVNDVIKKMEKKREITEDDSKEAQENIQKLTDKKIKAIDEIKTKKEKEVMEV